MRRGGPRTTPDSGAALARELGVTPPAIYKKLKMGMTVADIRNEWRAKRTSVAPTTDSDSIGGYKPARRLKPRNTDQATVEAKKGTTVEAKKATASVRVPVLPADSDEEQTESADGAVAASDFFIYKARKEKALAEGHEMDVLERQGVIVVREKYDRDMIDKITRHRDNLLRLPGELGDPLAAETNPAKCADMLDRELRRALELFALDDWADGQRAG